MSEIIIDSPELGVKDLPPEVRNTEVGAFRRMLTPKFIVGVSIVSLIVLFGVVFPFFTQNPNAISDIGLTPPSAAHLLGTTQTGQDVFAQLASATRGSLIIGVAVVVFLVIIAFTLLLFWLGARGQFMFLDNLARGLLSVGPVLQIDDTGPRV